MEARSKVPASLSSRAPAAQHSSFNGFSGPGLQPAYCDCYTTGLSLTFGQYELLQGVKVLLTRSNRTSRNKKDANSAFRRL